MINEGKQIEISPHQPWLIPKLCSLHWSAYAMAAMSWDAHFAACFFLGQMKPMKLDRFSTDRGMVCSIPPPAVWNP